MRNITSVQHNVNVIYLWGIMTTGEDNMTTVGPRSNSNNSLVMSSCCMISRSLVLMNISSHSISIQNIYTYT